MAGLLPFGEFLRELGVDAALRSQFRELKRDPRVIFPMDAQMRLIIDAAVAGEERVFGLEALANDPLFAHLSGGAVPSIDTVYRDLCRFDEEALAARETLTSEHGLAVLADQRPPIVHIDTTVMPVFGEQEGALSGPNPHYHGRPSYHPILACVAETNTVIGALLRPGDTSFGGNDVPFVERCIDRVRKVAPNHAMLLLKLLAFNLMRRYVRRRYPAIASFTAPWFRRELILVPGRLLRSSGRRRVLRIPELSLLGRQLNGSAHQHCDCIGERGRCDRAPLKASNGGHFDHIGGDRAR